MRMLAELPAPGAVAIDEPRVGVMLTQLNAIDRPAERLPQIVGINEMLATSPEFVLSEASGDAWVPWLRGLVLESFRDRLEREQRPSESLLAVKDPNSSEAAGQIVAITPRARILFLLRDGRDVVDSILDALLTSAWGPLADHGQRAIGEAEREKAVVLQSLFWLYRTEAVERACAALPRERSLIVRYEQLLEDTPAELARICKWLDVPDAEGWAAETAPRHRFARIPSEERGPGTRNRAAQPGLWRTNMTASEQSILELTIGKKLRELGYS